MLLTKNEIKTELLKLTNWKLTANSNSIEKEFVFTSFLEAIWFVNAVAPIAEKMNHHPEWSNVYNKITVILTTHDAKGITKKDIVLAKKIDEILNLI